MTAHPEHQDRPRSASSGGALLSILARCAGSLAVMSPWPALGVLLLRSQLEQPSEGFFFVGGITLLPLMILAIFGSAPEEVLIGICLLVWLSVAVLPWILFRRHLGSRWAVVGMLALQSLFALAQALMGALLVIGKSV